jgi:aspartyl-tRNA synthetase
MKRTHHCAQITRAEVGQTVTLSGWVDSIRDHGGILFIDLRDRAGVTQVKLNPKASAELGALAITLRPESVVTLSGEVELRPEEMMNNTLPTGEVELQVTALTVHNLSDTPPFPLDDAAGDKVNEDLRLTYRYLDLRRPRMKHGIMTRYSTTRTIRNFMDGQGFLEIETPLLFKSTPEGAREYLVPSRVNPGQCYALPQSPQQFKQILMVAGFEKYFQIAKCFRDEDLRADRQPEFTQLDIEASFIDREDLYALIEGLLKKIWKDVKGMDIPTPFPRMKFTDAMNRYGVDKPDTRFGFELVDLTETFRNSTFKVFQSTVASGGVIKAFNAKQLACLTQGELSALEETAKSLGAKGLAFIKAEKGEWKSPIVKFFSEAEKAALKEQLAIEEGDIVFFAAAGWEKACAILGRARLDCSQLLQKRGLLTIPADQFNFLWVVDFPLMSYDEEAKRFVSTHHPFTSPVEEDIPLLDSNPHAVRGQHYDIVLNGVELGGGSIRIHNPVLQKKVFEDVLKIPADVVESRFGYMLNAFKYGAPPHGGIALGLDRLVTILCGTTSIRDVIAFPKTQKGQCLMTQSPSVPTAKQLKDLHIASTALPQA